MTWGVSQGEAHLLLPMSLETLQALIVELLIAGSSVNTVKNVWCAIDRHRMTGHVPPLARPMLFRRMVKALASVRDHRADSSFQSQQSTCRRCCA